MIGGIDGRRDDWPPETGEVSVVCWLGGRQCGGGGSVDKFLVRLKIVYEK